MARILVFSDLHAHPFKPYSTILPNGMNSRLADAIDCIKQVHDAALAHGVDLVLFGGDMFHVRRHIAVQAFNATFEQMAAMSLDVPVVMIHGNHDQADKHGEVHGVHAFRTFATVVDRPGWVFPTGKSGQEYGILAVPYLEDLELLRKAVEQPLPTPTIPRLFLGHLGVQGAKIGADFVYENPNDVDVTDLCPAQFDAGFLGHFHEYQHITANFWFIGAPMQHSWGDRGQDRGYLVYDTETKEHTRHFLKTPRFELVEDRGQSRDLTDAYVRVKATRPWTDSEREEARKAWGARSVETILPQVKPVQVSRIHLKPDMSSQDMLEAYVFSGVAPVEELDEQYLLQLGQEIMKEIED